MIQGTFFFSLLRCAAILFLSFNCRTFSSSSPPPLLFPCASPPDTRGFLVDDARCDALDEMRLTGGTSTRNYKLDLAVQSRK